MPSRLFTKLRALLNLPTRVDAEFGRLSERFEERVREVQRAVKSQDVRRAIELNTERAETEWNKQRGDYAELQRELAAAKKEMHDHLLQYRLELGRLRALLENGSARQKEESDPLPVALETADSQRGSPAIVWEWLNLARCPGCDTAERTIVCEWNKSILLEEDYFADSPRYNYALCHGCGIVYATCRPVGAGYKALMSDFSETIGRGARANVDNPLLNPYPLSDEERERYRALIASGVFVSDHDPREHLDGVYQDRVENAAHVEILASLLDLQAARVLEVRSRAGTIVNGLRRRFGASVAAMPIFESQQLILRELYGIECSDLIDFDMFTIPFEGHFDLIACNHMLTHILRVDRFFDQIREHLKIGGHLYLYNELEENKFLGGGNSVINTLNALHLQVFDRESLIRLLKANGFDVVFAKLRNNSQICLARYTGDRAWTPMPVEERNRRIRAYSLARTRAILRAPKTVRDRFGAVWEDAIAEGVIAGIARFDEKGRLRLLKDG
jgi:2-polyprenyl-3-methyl-5-hydroxy-6-metoxy-1,4-benzoquinol methylase